MSVGDRIRIAREEKGISQEELAKRLGLKDKSSVCKIEKSGDNISTKSIKKYSDALGVSVAHIMGWDNDNIDDPSLQLQLFVDKPNFDTDEAIEIYKEYLSLSPEDQIAFRTLLKSLKSHSDHPQTD